MSGLGRQGPLLAVSVVLVCGGAKGAGVRTPRVAHLTWARKVKVAGNASRQARVSKVGKCNAAPVGGAWCKRGGAEGQRAGSLA